LQQNVMQYVSRLVPADAHLLEDMPQQRPPLTQLLSDVMALVLADLQAAGAQPDEQLLMGMARVAGIMGDADKVFTCVLDLAVLI
jgi:hypothetical protein